MKIVTDSKKNNNLEDNISFRILQIIDNYVNELPKYSKALCIFINQKYEEETVEMITKAGYDILILWEHEFRNRNNPRITDEVRKKILDFLKPV